MSAKILDGSYLAEQINKELAIKINKLSKKPGLAVILIGENPASQLYVSLKEKACNKVDILFCLYKFAANVSEAEVLKTIDWLNNDKQIDGILVQLPLPESLDENRIISAIKLSKEVDGFNSRNLELLEQHKEIIIPGLINGILKLIKSSQEILAGKTAVLIAKSPEFRQSTSQILLREKIKTISLNPDTRDLAKQTVLADIIITAVGRPKFIKPEMIKDGAIIIDVGISKKGKKISGDVALGCWKKAGYISPVPGGVGPLTVAGLLENTYLLASKQV